jgi:glutamyl-tRNA reductase
MSLRAFCCVGVNHKTAPVELREKVAFSPESLVVALPQLVALDDVDEAVVVSTCNRVELYVAGDRDRAPVAVAAFLRAFHGLADGVLDDHLVHRSDDEAVLHLFRVAAALDAIVVGEPQILGQVKDAFFHAVSARSAGPIVTRAFHQAFTTAKRVRTETAIASSAANVASAGVDLAASIFGDLNGVDCVLVGAGDMGELAARHFGAAGARLTVANRSLERASRLASDVGGVARDLVELPRLLVDADVVLVSTGAPTHIVTLDMVRAALKHRRYRPLLLVDISVPRNVDPRVAELDNCYVHDVDDLGSVVEENLARRADEAHKAEAIVREEVARARRARAERRAVPLIKALREKLQGLAAIEAEKTLAVLGPQASEKQRRSVEAMANAIVAKVLHEPMTRLKAAAAGNHDDDAALLSAAATLFGVELDDDGVDAARALAEAEAAIRIDPKTKEAA